MWIEHEFGLLHAELAVIRKLLFFIIKQETAEMSELDTLKADVAAETAAEGAVLASLADLKAQAAVLQTKLDAALAAGDVAAISALAKQVEDNTAKLQAAVAVAAPAPAPPAAV